MIVTYTANYDPITGAILGAILALPNGGTQCVPLTDPTFLAWYNAQDPAPFSLTAPNPAAPQIPRTAQAIADQLFALTTAQKNKIITALFGQTGGTTASNALILTSPGVGGWAITAAYAANISATGVTSFNAIAQILLAACYVFDNPTFLVNPSFDPTINVSGTQPLY